MTTKKETLNLLPFKAEHLDWIELKEGQEYMKGNMEIIKQQAGLGLAFTLMAGEKVVCCSGVSQLWNNSAEAWLIVSKDFPQYGKIAAKLIKKFLMWVEPPVYSRVQMSVRSDFDEAVRFAEFLGFEREGVMRKYGPDGVDYYMYARVR